MLLHHLQKRQPHARRKGGAPIRRQNVRRQGRPGSGFAYRGQDAIPQIRQAEKAKDARWTIDRLWTAYRVSLESRPDKSRKGISVDGNRYDNFIKDRLGSKEPSEVQHLDIERLRRDLQKTRCTLIGHPESTRTLSPATIRAILTLLKRISEYVFPGEDGGQRVTIQKALRRIGA
jgi:hypothetical protein